MCSISLITVQERLDCRTKNSKDKYFPCKKQNLVVDCRELRAQMVKEDPSFLVDFILVLI